MCPNGDYYNPSLPILQFQLYVTDEILVDKLGSVTTIGINRPQKRNCINQATATKLSQAILEFEEDDSALVGVLHGIGGNFCAGYDLEELSGFDAGMKLDNEAGHGPMVSSYITDSSTVLE